jgi:vancomycin permeability regulator SanA
LDYAGFDTYSSLYRARDIFLVDELIIFTQDFHLKRAMYIGKKLGIETYGIETNLRRYLKENYYDFREVFARVKAFLNVDVLYSSPKYL